MPKHLATTRKPNWAEDLLLDKLDHGGSWRLTYAPANAPTVLRLCIEVGGPGDAYHFHPEVERVGMATSKGADFFI